MSPKIHLLPGVSRVIGSPRLNCLAGYIDPCRRPDAKPEHPFRPAFVASPCLTLSSFRRQESRVAGLRCAAHQRRTFECSGPGATDVGVERAKFGPAGDCHAARDRAEVFSVNLRDAFRRQRNLPNENSSKNIRPTRIRGRRPGP